MVRADARRSESRIRQVAVAAFTEAGLTVPLADLASRAEVSKGTIYHRFGGREGLLDAVLDDVVLAAFDGLAARVEGLDGPWDRLRAYLDGIWALQYDEPAVCDVLTRVCPESLRLTELCDREVARVEGLLAAADAAGVLRPGLVPADLHHIVVGAALILRHGVRPTRAEHLHRCGLWLTGLAAGRA